MTTSPLTRELDNYVQYLSDVLSNLTASHNRNSLVIVLIDGANILYTLKQKYGLANRMSDNAFLTLTNAYVRELFGDCHTIVDFVTKYEMYDLTPIPNFIASYTRLPFDDEPGYNAGLQARKKGYTEWDDATILRKLYAYSQIIPPSQLYLISCDGYNNYRRTLTGKANMDPFNVLEETYANVDMADYRLFSHSISSEVPIYYLDQVGYLLKQVHRFTNHHLLNSIYNYYQIARKTHPGCTTAAVHDMTSINNEAEVCGTSITRASPPRGSRPGTPRRRGIKPPRLRRNNPIA